MKLKDVDNLCDAALWGISPLRMYMVCIDGFFRGELPLDLAHKDKVTPGDSIDYLIEQSMDLLDDLEECLGRLNTKAREGVRDEADTETA